MLSVNCYILVRKDDFEGKNWKNANCSCVFMKKRELLKFKIKKNFIKLDKLNYIKTILYKFNQKLSAVNIIYIILF